MPALCRDWNEDRKGTVRYVLPGKHLRYGSGLTHDPSAEGMDRLREIRRDAATALNEMHVISKELAARKDFVACREMKDVIRYFTQLGRAATLVIGWWTEIGDKRTANWPTESADLIDYCWRVSVEA